MKGALEFELGPQSPDRDSVRRLCAGLPKANPVRAAAEAVLEGRTVEGEALDVCRAALGRQSALRWRERTAAAWVLGEAAQSGPAKEVSAESLARVLDNFDLKKETVARIGRAALFGIPMAIAAFALLAGSPIGGFNIREPIFPAEDGFVIFPGLIVLAAASFVTLAGFAAGGYLSLYIDHRRISRIRLEAARALGKLRVPRFLGALARGLSDLNPGIRRASREAFSATLPMVNEELEGQLPRSLGAQLCGVLGSASTETQRAILPALAHVAGGEAIVTVERIVRKASDPALIAAAQEVLPVLKARQERARISDRLLRPSQEASDGEDLLRPAYGSESAQPDLLLRSSSNEDEE